MATPNDPVLHNEFNPIEYERRHSALEVRIGNLETTVRSLVTRDDLYALKTDLMQFRADVSSFREAIHQAETLTGSMATKTDVEWMKQFFWRAVGLALSVAVVMLGILVAHVYGGAK